MYNIVHKNCSINQTLHPFPQGVSGAAYRLCHQLGGSRLHIPLRNTVNSLNVISAASVMLFRVQQELLARERQEAPDKE